MVSTPPQPASRAVWPPDDTEESILGTDRHQMTITNVRVGINETAHAAADPGHPVPWQALSQLRIFGFARPDGSRYAVYPDVFVYPHPVGQNRGSYSLALDGPPVLIVEVASEATYDSDLDLLAGKGWSYANAGVREYLVPDPTGLYLPELVRAWRLEAGGYQAWLPGPDGRWQSREIGAAFTVEDELATVYTAAGRRQLREGEIAEAVETLDHTTEALDRAREELARKDAEIADLRRRLEGHNGL